MSSLMIFLNISSNLKITRNLKMMVLLKNIYYHNFGMFSIADLPNVIVVKKTNIPKGFAHSEVCKNIGLSEGHPIVWKKVPTFRRASHIRKFGKTSDCPKVIRLFGDSQFQHSEDSTKSKHSEVDNKRMK